MNLYKFHTNPEQLDGYENRLRVPMMAYEYGDKHGFAGELVSAVAKDPQWAYKYARFVIKGRFPEGEATIATDPGRAYEYADYVINGRFPEAEAAIATSPTWAYHYAKYVIKDRWPEGEAAIAKTPKWASGYERDFGIKL